MTPHAGVINDYKIKIKLSKVSQRKTVTTTFYT